MVNALRGCFEHSVCRLTENVRGPGPIVEAKSLLPPGDGATRLQLTQWHLLLTVEIGRHHLSTSEQHPAATTRCRELHREVYNI